MEFNNVLANRQSKAKAIDLPDQSCVHSVKAIEDPIQMFWRFLCWFLAYSLALGYSQRTWL
jgi:hypothetical protein